MTELTTREIETLKEIAAQVVDHVQATRDN